MARNQTRKPAHPLMGKFVAFHCSENGSKLLTTEPGDPDTMEGAIDMEHSASGSIYEGECIVVFQAVRVVRVSPQVRFETVAAL